jgi:hypothetical protein
MKQLENYLKFLGNSSLNESFFQAAIGKLKFSAKYTALITGLGLGWKSAKTIFSNAERKCGSFSNSPAKKGCVARERIKGCNEQLRVLAKAKSVCNRSTNPEKCHEKIDKKINTIRLRKRMNEIKLKEYENSLNESFLALVVAGIVVDKAFAANWKAANLLFSSAARKCRKYKGNEYNICRSKLRLSALEKKQQILRRVTSYCKKEKDPSKCLEKINSENEKLQARIQLEKENIILYQKQS